MIARAGGFLAFVALAALLHVAAFALARSAGETAAGAGGTATISVRGGSAALAALVEAWSHPPSTGEATALAPPPAPVRPPRQAAAPVALPTLPALTPAANERPARLDPATRQVPARPGGPPVPRARPAGLEAPALARPTRPLPAAAARAPATAAASVAAGTGGTVSEGVSGRAAQKTGDADAQPRALAAWGVALQRALQRGLGVVPGPRPGREMRVLIALEVTREGRVLRTGIARSSGRPDLDRAALAAVARSGPLPPAPETLTAPAYPFEVPIVFEPA